jgi:hypothetical protein
LFFQPRHGVVKAPVFQGKGVDAGCIARVALFKGQQCFPACRNLGGVGGGRQGYPQLANFLLHGCSLLNHAIAPRGQKYQGHDSDHYHSKRPALRDSLFHLC